MNKDEKKKSYKEIHGVTRVGNFLRGVTGTVLPKVLDLVGLGDVAGALGIISESPDNAGLSNSEVTEMLNLHELDMRDMEGARKMYTDTDHETADYIARRVINYNLWVVLVAIVIEIFSVILIDDKVLIAIISGAVGGLTTALLQERQQILSFFFSSSRGSKEKQKELNNKQ